MAGLSRVGRPFYPTVRVPPGAPGESTDQRRVAPSKFRRASDLGLAKECCNSYADRVTDFLALGDQRFLLLTTFRKTGVAVPTPVWVARDGDALLVSTPKDSGKVKRIRNNPTVQLVPCGRMGKPKRGHHSVKGNAVILDDAAAITHATELLRAKMPLEYPVIMKLEGSLGVELEKRVVVRITSLA